MEGSNRKGIRRTESRSESEKGNGEWKEWNEWNERNERKEERV